MTPQPSTDFDLSPRSLAQRFGSRTIRLIDEGKDPGVAAALAFHFAGQARKVVIGRITEQEPYGVSL